MKKCKELSGQKKNNEIKFKKIKNKKHKKIQKRKEKKTNKINKKEISFLQFFDFYLGFYVTGVICVGVKPERQD